MVTEKTIEIIIWKAGKKTGGICSYVIKTVTGSTAIVGL